MYYIKVSDDTSRPYKCCKVPEKYYRQSIRYNGFGIPGISHGHDAS